MLLSEFIRNHQESIESEWVRFAGSLRGPGESMTRTALLDHAAEILAAIVFDMNQPESRNEQAEKSKGRGMEQRLEAVGRIHAALRIETGFKLHQLVAEYRALRASVLRLWEKEAAVDGRGVTRFNEAVDEALVEATNQYSMTMERYRDQFLAILGHDLRNPLASITLGATLMTRSESLDDSQARVASRIRNSADRMNRMVGDLLDLTRSHLGAGIPIVRVPIDLLPVCHQVMAEFEGACPGQPLNFHATGDLHGDWDRDRLAQVLSNLIGNAIQHGAPNSPIEVTARANGAEITLEVHNRGAKIPGEAMPTLFEPLIRHPSAETKQSNSLGLGLYIAREVVLAHDGELTVNSTDNEGTTFEVRLPRTSENQGRRALPSPPAGRGAPAPADSHPFH